MIIKPMPSPQGTNREKLFILQGGRGVLNPRGAYDSRRSLAYDTLGASPNDPVKQIAEWAKENLSADDLSRLIGALGREAQQNMPAADDEPTIDPMQTRGRAPGARVGMDAAATKGLFERFPEIARIGRAF
jgi:hypothetical protein